MTQNKKSYLDYSHSERLQFKRALVNGHLAQQATPFMILQESEVCKSLDFFAKHLPFIGLFYAMKANPHPQILQLMRERGHCLDVASAGEIHTALNAGFAPDQMILANPYKNEATLKALFENKIGMFTYDNANELHRIAQYRTRHKYSHSPMSLLRMRPLVETKAQVNLSAKFGAAPESAFALIKLANDLQLRPGGIAYHVGSNCQNLDLFIKNFHQTIKFVRTANAELNLDMKIIDVGGGFPNHSATARGVDDLDSFYSEMARGMKSEIFSDFKIIAEPGRTVAGPAGISVMTVIGKRDHLDTPWLILDDGVYGSLNPVVFDHGQFIYIPVSEKYHTKANRDRLVPYTLGGPTCDSFDTIAREILLPADLEVGEQIFVVDNGAYSSASSTAFNGFAPAKVIVEPMLAPALKRTS